MTTNDGGPAFPGEYEHQSGPHTWHQEGMSKLDYFAAAALQGMLASAETEPDIPPAQYRSVLTRGAYDFAEAMLAERERRASDD